ncbi:hypothetical protein [Lentibacillus cibarius]|uniref:Major facilitator superfamily (MFS) profile domain-containing protein n=1 Tax=Lentibacillus cibarius TaxID=2583219 RepID=A0A5S3QR05_9BACI|nr:hypothetical protein [Lentibacillus cibarius]TMN23046.1 hypothetical protein FFL34_13855 [Lentibacillus cibarius]
MAIAVGYAVALLGTVIAYLLSEGKPKKTKYKVWGIALMLPISPALAFSIGLTYAVIVKNGWAALMMWYIFPLIFIIGLIMLLVGIFSKEEAK